MTTIHSYRTPSQKQKHTHGFKHPDKEDADLPGSSRLFDFNRCKEAHAHQYKKCREAERIFEHPVVIEQVNRVLFEGVNAADAVKELMLRDKKVENIDLRTLYQNSVEIPW